LLWGFAHNAVTWLVIFPENAGSVAKTEKIPGSTGKTGIARLFRAAMNRVHHLHRGKKGRKDD
jgi:hypothetical protein